MLPQAKDTRSHPKLESVRKDSPESLRREHGPANPLISDFLLPELKEYTSVVFKLPNLW